MIKDFGRDWLFWAQSKEAVSVNLPHDAMLTEARTASCHNGDRTGYFPGGKYKYEKSFHINERDLGKYIALRFEGVYHNATVLLNGKTLFFHAYGYTQFTVDLSDSVTSGTNIVTVLVDNSLEPNSRWYTGSGIYQPVFLIIKEKNYIDDITIITKSYSPAVVEISAKAEGAAVEIFDGNQLVARGQPGEITIPNAVLWSAENPKLYRCVVRTKYDEVEQLFGIRKIEWGAKTGLLVNGAEVLLRGGCVHHDNGILGACAFPAAEERRVSILKRAGYNAIPSSHNPCFHALLCACDKLGMYVIDEAFDGWFTPKTYHDYSRNFYGEYRNILTEMIRRDINHPCVIMYSIGNEVTETADRCNCGKQDRRAGDCRGGRKTGYSRVKLWVSKV